MASRSLGLYRYEIGNISELLPKIWPQKVPKISQKWAKSPQTVGKINIT
jgi:hypothetical protein